METTIGGWYIAAYNHNPKKENPKMILLFKYLLRFVITLCITVAAIFMTACAAWVVYFAIKGGIKIRKISEEEGCENE